MNQKILIIVSLVAMLLMAGCGMSRLERDYGTSHRLARFNQTFNSEAEKNLDPVVGLNGQAAQFAIQKHYKSFEAKEAAPVYSINIGNLGR